MWWEVVIAYVVFAVAHTLFKVGLSVYDHLRVWRHLRKHKVPTFEGDLLTGFATDFAKNTHRLHDRRIEQLGDLPRLAFRPPVMAPMFFVLTRSPDDVEHILKKRFDVYTKPRPDTDLFWHFFGMWIGHGIFSALHGVGAPDGGHLWTVNRKIAANIFTRGNFKDLMRDTFVEKGRVLLEVLDAVPKGGKVDMQQKSFAFTMDSIMWIFFGRKTETLRESVDEYARAYDVAHNSLMMYFFHNLATLSMWAVLPWPLGAWTRRMGGLVPALHLRLHPFGQRFLRAVRQLDVMSAKIIDAKREDPDLAHQRDLLALFMNAEDDDGVKYSDPKYSQFLRDVCLNFIIAGRDTTACTLTWALYLLATNPDVQRKVCEEIDDKLGDADPTYESIAASNVPYLNGLVYETLRLFPPVPQDPKEAMEDDVLPSGLPLLKGMQVHYFPFAMGRDASRYPDPLKVKPERWIPFKQPNPYEFPVFQAGPRICLGMNMAVLEAKIVLAMVLRRFTFTLLEGEQQKITYSLMITMSLRNNDNLAGNHQLWLHPHKRR